LLARPRSLAFMFLLNLSELRDYEPIIFWIMMEDFEERGDLSKITRINMFFEVLIIWPLV